MTLVFKKNNNKIEYYGEYKNKYQCSLGIGVNAGNLSRKVNTLRPIKGYYVFDGFDYDTCSRAMDMKAEDFLSAIADLVLKNAEVDDLRKRIAEAEKDLEEMRVSYGLDEGEKLVELQHTSGHFFPRQIEGLQKLYDMGRISMQEIETRLEQTFPELSTITI